MNEEKWIEVYSFSEIPDKIKEKITSEPGDNRRSTSIYCYAKPELLLEEIISDLTGKNIPLVTIEKEKIKTLLDSDEFREFVYKHIERYKNKFFSLKEYPSDFLLIKEALSRHCSITTEYDSLIERLFSNREKKQKLLRERLSNDKIYIIPEIRKLIEGIDKILAKKLSRLDDAVNDEVSGLFNMFTRFNEESLRINNE